MMGGMGRQFDGSYAEYVLVPQQNVFPLQTRLEWKRLGALPEMLQTVHGSLHIGLEIERAKNILVRGATSSIGFTAISLARSANLEVTATTRNPAKADELKAAGATHVIVDLFGVFDADSEVVAGTARRAFDSRDSGARVAAGSVTVIDVAAAGIDPVPSGVVVNLTAIDAPQAGYLTAYPCADGRPNASNVNVTSGRVVANAAIIAPDDAGTICVFSLSSTHLIVDLVGTIGAPFQGRTPVRVLDTRS